MSRVKRFSTADKLAAAKLDPKRRVPKMRKCCKAEVEKAVDKSEELVKNLAKKADDLQTQLEGYDGAIRGARQLLDYLDAGRFRTLAEKLKLIGAASDIAQIIKDVLTDAAFTLEGIAERRDAVVEFSGDRWQMSGEEFNKIIRGSGEKNWLDHLGL